MSVSNIEYPCTVCIDNCSDDQPSICCDNCNDWTHFSCTNLSKKKLNKLSKSTSSYLCVNCHVCVTCPCCQKTCKENHNCIFCTFCDRWIHLKCSKLKLKEFQMLSTSNDDYNCLKCSKFIFENLLPFHAASDSDFMSLSSNNVNSSNSTLNISLPKPYLSPSDIKHNHYKKHNLSFLSVNIRSLNKNFSKLEILLKLLNFNPDVISVAETWINDKKPPLYSLDGYKFIYKACVDRVGGVGFFIKDKLKYNIIDNLNINDDKCEDLWIELSLSKNKKITLGSIYKHPHHNFKDFQSNFVSIIDSLNKDNKNFIAGGDFNIDLNKSNNLIKNYINEVESQGCLQTVNHLTRIPHNQNSSLIDHVYTNLPQIKIFTETIAYELSDHLPNITVLNTNKQIYTLGKIKIRDTKNFEINTR